MVDIAVPERFRLSDLVQRYLQAIGDKRAIVADPAAEGEARLGHIHCGKGFVRQNRRRR
ncbi:hypothetical protein [Cupriavidus alkaliphilus]|uniref:hypothetical protein n=1 Tax=Cupriavidus alkaliphilus TaxID=942866 RepID=UPI0016194D6E|nr:hypothetical protein [Cupriavidus alkaliphilus]MBB3013352.1 hypothetical protein [Cupriavidus alkaliphilus]